MRRALHENKFEVIIKHNGTRAEVQKKVLEEIFLQIFFDNVLKLY